MTDNTIKKLYDSVSLQKGLGYSGRRVTIEELNCKTCSYDRLIKIECVFPENPSEIEYVCRNPNCPCYESASSIIIPSIL